MWRPRHLQKTYMQTIAEQANKAAITLMRDGERREQLAMDVCVDPSHERTNSLRSLAMEASMPMMDREEFERRVNACARK